MKLFLILIAVSGICIAHSGRTNSSGCHNDRKNGGYHCHRADDFKLDSNRNPASTKDHATNAEAPKEHRKSLVKK